MTSTFPTGLTCLPFWTSKQAIQIDRESIQNQASLGLELMEQAGYWVAMAALSRSKLSQDILIVAGNGNNGGDALVAARILTNKGLRPEVWLISREPKNLSEARRIQEERLLALGLNLHLYQPGCFSRCHHERELLIIDGLLGLGLSGSLRPGVYRDCLSELAELTTRHVIAIDLPSGMNADKWQQSPAILRADCTVSFGAAKPVHLLAPASESCGEILVRKIDFDQGAIHRALHQHPQRLGYLDQVTDLKKPPKIWRHLKASSHKFDRGHVLVAGGSSGKWGAAIMAARSAASAGAGWVSLALNEPADGISVPPYITQEFDLFKDGMLVTKTLINFIQSRKLKALVIGPGCVKSPLSLELLKALQELVRSQALFVLIDAGALANIGPLLKGMDQTLVPDRFLLTPHPGEWLKMGTGLEPIGDLSSLEQAQRSMVQELGVSVLYKSATPLSPQPIESKHLALASSQTHLGLARAGTGDLLAGLAAVIGMNGIPGYLAGLVAHQWLVLAAEYASKKTSVHGLLPTDLLLEIQRISD